MPAELTFFDMSASATTPNWLEPIPVTLGPNWQPGDIRIFCNYYLSYFESATIGIFDWGNVGFVPPGFTGFGPNNTTQVGGTVGGRSHTLIQMGYGVISWRRLQVGDTDTFVQPTLATTPYVGTMNAFAMASATVRGVDPNSTPSLGGLTFPVDPETGGGSQEGTYLPTCNSFSVPGAGTIVLWASSGAYVNDPNDTSIQYVGNSGNAIGVPTGWTGLVATPNSGNSYYQYDTNPASVLIAKNFSSSGSSGSITLPTGQRSSSIFQGCRIFLTPAPDVIGTAGNASTTTAATAATYSSSTTVRGTSGSASTTAAASTAFNPVEGFWISDPLVLSGNPVTGSKVRWKASVPDGTSVKVETSINNGASWDLATENQPVPRLLEGDTTTVSVLARITLKRIDPDGDAPKVTSFELAVSADTSVDELVPIGFGLIDDVTVHATAGTTGSGSSTNVAGSTAVIGRGGGQTGGGTGIKIHVNDMSFSIKRNVWQMPYTIPSGLNYGDAIKAMVQDRLPKQSRFNISTTTRTTPLLVYGLQQGGDPWQDIQELAGAIGYEAFFDAAGVFVCRPIPNPAVGEPVWTFDQSANPVIAEAEFDLSSDQTFNDIVVVGQSTSSSNPFSAEAFDNDPSSPTYILGDYGRVTQRVTSSLITSQDQAQEMADAALYASLGAAATVTLTVVPMPALEPGDIVKISCGNIGVDGTYVINSMTTPLSAADPQQLTCFSQSTMPNSLGRTVRTVGDGHTTSNSTTVTSATANFDSGDVSAIIYGPGIPVGTSIASVTNSTTVVMSQKATVTASNVAITIYDSSLS